MLSQEACKSLAKMGWPQEQRPQLCWVDYGPGYGGWVEGYFFDDLMPLGCPWVACPSEIEALDWLEKELGYHWRRDIHGYSATALLRIFAKEANSNPSDLILAIFAHWQANQAVPELHLR